MTARAFAVEQGKQDLSKAKEYGRIVYLFKADGERSSIWSNDFPQEVLTALEEYNYDPENDYLIVAGSMVPIALAVGRLVSQFGSIKALLYNSSEGCYISRILGA